jgi:tyrosyl-tRNA synthetase
MTNVFDEFKWRGSVYDFTEDVPNVLGQEKITAYIGFDPTADSLHVGSLAVIMVLARLQRFGHTPIALAGGGTGMIGDPSGKTQERQLLTIEQIEANVEAQKLQLAHFLDFEAKSNPAQIENNADWLRALSMMDFLRDTGKHFTVNYMIAKDSVKSRLNREDGISYTEFSYMLLQAYDFLHLFDHHNCVMQAGGSDQWGNITAGIELIRKVRGQKAYGLVCPLITTADGTKFGKTEAGAIWLDPKRTSPYRFYQYWLNQDDRDIITYLKYFTWLTQPEIEELDHKVSECPEEREAQRTLAQEMTRLVHDETALAKAEQASRVLFGGDIAGLTGKEIQDIFADAPSSQIPKKEFEAGGISVVNLLDMTGLASSRGDARRLITGGGIYVNNIRVSDAVQEIALEESIEGQFLILRKGKKYYHLVQVVG